MRTGLKVYLYGTAIACALQLADGAPVGRNACGVGQQTTLPNGVSVESEPHNGHAVLTITSKGEHVTVPVPGVLESVREICKAAAGRLVIVGPAGGLDNIAILQAGTGTLEDSFYGFSSAVSPDGRWIARRRFYPAQSVASEQYLLYDVQKSALQNRLRGVASTDMDFVGALIYPTISTIGPPDNVNVPEEETHRFRSDAFFWSADSSMLVFADAVAQDLTIVLVSVHGARPAVFTHRVTTAEICSPDADSSILAGGLVLGDAMIRNDGLTVDLSFRSDDDRCRVRQLSLSAADFSPAQSEAPAQKGQKKASKPLDQ